MRQLKVYWNDIYAGLLTEERPGEGYCFVYDADYLASDTPAISVTMAKRKDAYLSKSLFPLFTNMLPEGANRKIICRANHIDETDLFGLLITMADNDFIGAVHLKK